MLGSGQTSWSVSASAPGFPATVAAPAYESTRVQGTVWVDDDVDGIHDGGEDGLAHVLVVATDSTGAVAFADVTDATGNYTMLDLRPGDYRLTFTAPAGYTMNGTANVVDVPATIVSGEMTDVDRPAYDDEQLGSISGSAWHDEDADGVKDTGESYLSGVLVELLDSEGDPVLDENDDPIQATTDGTGLFAFADLEPGLYVVQFTAPSGHVMQSSRALSTTRTILTPGLETIAHEGAYQPETFVSGVIWDDDMYGDGIRQSGELGLEGAIVSLQDLSGGTVFDLNSNPVEPATTDSNGSFSFPDVEPGEYLITVVTPAGHAMEGSGIQTWKGTFSVGNDPAMEIAAYMQAEGDNPVAPPEAPPVEVKWQTAWRAADPWRAAKPMAKSTVSNGEVVWQASPFAGQTSVIKSFKPAEIDAVAPPGPKVPSVDTEIILIAGPGVKIDQETKSRAVNAVKKRLEGAYKALESKQKLFRDGMGQHTKKAPKPEETVMTWLQQPGLGLLDAGIDGLQLRLSGGIPQWILREGFHINPEKLKADSKIDFKLDKNWDFVSMKAAVEFTIGKDTAVFSPGFAFNSDGKVESVFIDIKVKY